MASRHATQRRNRLSDRRPRFIIGLVLGGVVTVLLLLTIAARNTPAASVSTADRLNYDPILGNPAAPVTIIEYGAYGCSACRAWHQAGIVEQILAEFPDQVNFIFRDFPVIVPAYDRLAAEIAQCALDQSQAAFWNYHDVLYNAAVPGMGQAELIALAEEAGLEVAALQTCVTSGVHRETVAYDLERALNLALPGTPAFLVNGSRLFNASPDVLRTAVLHALQPS